MDRRDDSRYREFLDRTYRGYEQGRSTPREAICPCCGLSVTRHSAYDWQRCQERHR